MVTAQGDTMSTILLLFSVHVLYGHDSTYPVNSSRDPIAFTRLRSCYSLKLVGRLLLLVVHYQIIP